MAKNHQLSHPGVMATTRLIQERYVWPNINRDCRNFVRQCIACQRAKIQRHTKSPLSTFDGVTRRFEHINIDIVGPLLPSKGFSYILTAIARYSKWPEAYPIANITAETITTTLISGWISRFGVPSKITTDRGAQFESILFNQINQAPGVKHLRTTSYHPQANGMLER